MIDTSRAPLERRHHARIVAKGAVTFRAAAHTQRGRIANVGPGGMFVQTNVGAPAALLGHFVELEIRLDDGHAEWLRSTGRIARIGASGLAIAFEAPPIALLHMLDRLGVAARASARVLSVVLIDADHLRRSAMAAGFRATGCRVAEAATPLEAIVRLGETTFEPDVIAVADSQTSAANDMRSFVEREHPQAKLVTIGDELFAPDGVAHWLSATASSLDLPGRIREVLVTPLASRSR